MLNEIEELRLLFIEETEMEKQLKKYLFIVLSILMPILELLIDIFQIKNMIESVDDYDKYGIDLTFVTFFSFLSLFCTWGMISVCFFNLKTILVLLIIKGISIIILLLISTVFPNFYYYLVFNTILYGLYYTLIIVYKIFKKSIL